MPTVNINELKNLRTTMDNAVMYFDGQIAAVKGLAIEAGAFTEADTLDALVKKKGEDLSTLMTNIRKVFVDIRDKLDASFAAYNNTSSENEDFIKVFTTDLVNLIRDDLPGLLKK